MTVTGIYLGRTSKRIRVDTQDGRFFAGTAQPGVYLRWGIGDKITITYHREGGYNIITAIGSGQ